MLLENTFVHHVYFWLHHKYDKQALLNGLQTLQSIEHIGQMHIGMPADTYRAVVDSSYDVSLLLLFESGAAEEAYQTHPVHEKFAHEIASVLCSKIVVYDSVNI